MLAQNKWLTQASHGEQEQLLSTACSSCCLMISCSRARWLYILCRWQRQELYNEYLDDGWLAGWLPYEDRQGRVHHMCAANRYVLVKTQECYSMGHRHMGCEWYRPTAYQPIPIHSIWLSNLFPILLYYPPTFCITLAISWWEEIGRSRTKACAIHNHGRQRGNIYRLLHELTRVIGYLSLVLKCFS